MADSKSETGKAQSEPGIASWVRKKKVFKDCWGAVKRIQESAYWGVPLAKYGPT